MLVLVDFLIMSDLDSLSISLYLVFNLIIRFCRGSNWLDIINS